MAEQVVSNLVQKLGVWIIQEAELLWKVRNEIKYIKDELQSIEAFLRDADAMVMTDAGARVWVGQVFVVSREIEDVLVMFLRNHYNEQADQHEGVACINEIIRVICDFFKRWKVEHEIATQIIALRAKVQEISNRRERYKLSNISSVARPVTRRDPRNAALFLEESELVGIEGPKEKLISDLLGADTRLGVISVYGMGGLGKTTLAKKVYNSPAMRNTFPLRAWITVSQAFDTRSLLKYMFKQLFGENEELEQMEVLTLKQTLNDRLRDRKYVVVLDDIWTSDAWRDLKDALPNDGTSSSRIIITTRNRIIAEDACGDLYGYVHYLKSLNPDDSWKLFCRKAFSLRSPAEPVDFLREQSEKFLNKCKGLPLGIVTIGGFLSRKPLYEWNDVYKNFSEHLGRPTEDLVEDMRLVISFSRDNLPPHLNLCFMHLGYFPEDYSIKCSTLLRMWAAEGYVSLKDGKGRTMEEVAKGYLDKLIERSLVQVEKVDIRGRIVRCKVHDLIRDFIIGEATQGSSSSSARRVLEVEVANLETVNDLFLRYLRVGASPFFLSDFSQLRKFKIIETLLRKFKIIETLDLRGVHIYALDATILELVELRNLLMGKTSDCPAVTLPEGMGKLRKLETLGMVNLGEDHKGIKNGLLVGELGKLTQLRKLSVCNLSADDESELLTCVEKMEFLRSFKVSISIWGTWSPGHNKFSQPILSCSPSLQSLSIKGEMGQLPPRISSMRNLSCLVLSGLCVEDNFIESLEVLFSLAVLELGGRFAELRFSKGGFPSLRKLVLESFDLMAMNVERGAMPIIQALELKNNLYVLKEVPLGLEHLTTLKEIYVASMSIEFRKGLINLPWAAGNHLCITTSPWKRRAKQ